MRKLLAVVMVLAVALTFVGCYDPTPYDEGDLEMEREKAYKEGYEDGYAEGYEAGQLSILESEDYSASTTRSTNPFPGEDETEPMYYVTRTGKCFHRRGGCSYTAIAWFKTREEAIAAGYSPCSKCNP